MKITMHIIYMGPNNMLKIHTLICGIYFIYEAPNQLNKISNTRANRAGEW